jgi:molybdate transport system substrate-binding protein
MLMKSLELPKMLLAMCLLVVTAASSACAEEIKFLCAEALQPAMDQLIADFQKTSGHKVTVSYANVGTITNRLRNEEIADLSVTSPQQWEDLQKESKLAPDFRVPFVKVGIGFFVKQGAAKPDLSSVEAVKRSLLNVRAIAITDPARGSPSAVIALRLFDRLGIAAELKPKTKLMLDLQGINQALINGEADIGINQASEIARTSGLELVGPLPADLQIYTVFVASIPKTAKQIAAAKSLVKHLTSPNAATIFKAKGLEPS